MLIYVHMLIHIYGEWCAFDLHNGMHGTFMFDLCAHVDTHMENGVPLMIGPNVAEYDDSCLHTRVTIGKLHSQETS